jgi:hypothetical protein
MTSRTTGCRTDLRFAHTSTSAIRHRSIDAFALVVLASIAGAAALSGGAACKAASNADQEFVTSRF